MTQHMTEKKALISLLTVAMLALAACGQPAAPAIEAPAVEVATEAATEIATEAATETPPPETAGDAAPAAAAGARTFTIVPEQSSAEYFVEEEFFGAPIPFVTANGVTSAINGSMELVFDGSTVTLGANQFEVDLTTLQSDEARRDRAIRERWLESNSFPLATFVGKEAANLPADADFGKDVAFQVNGDMTIRDVTTPLTFDITARIDGNTLTGTAQTFLFMKDFGFEPPSVGGMLQVTDGVSVTVKFTAQE